MRDLATSYRPDNWDEIVGQDVLVKTLQKEIQTDTVSHAYLFCGPRGTGKTTTAKVFAIEVNGQVIEMDAASNNGVESIRELRQDVMFLPVDNKTYKVYIIDEVHMLSTGAFNALLKTLEEPPQHIIFVLATTDPQKLPITITSRCERFDLKRITQEDIIKRLDFIAKRENIAVEYEALEYIAKVVDGGMRDAIKLMQKCSSLAEIITPQTVVDALGSVNIEHLDKMTTLLMSKDAKDVLTYFNNLVKEGTDVKIFLADLVQYLTDNMVSKVSENDYDIDEYMNLADELVSLLYNLRNMTQIKTLTELKLLKICNIKKETAQTKTVELGTSIQVQGDVDVEALKRIMDKLTAHDKRFVSNEMEIDMLKARR